MKLAILGTDGDILRLAAAAIAQGHEIACLIDLRPTDTAEIHQLFSRDAEDAAAATAAGRVPPNALPPQPDDWELLLDRSVADAVLVGPGTANSELRAEQLKRLATEGAPLLAVHPVVDSVLAYYELDMIRREYGGILRHYNPLAGHPMLAEMANWIRAGHPAIGQIHQFSCERRLDDTTSQNVLAHLARDIELITAVAGDIRRVSALTPRSGIASFAALQVQMTSDCPATLRWSVGSRMSGGSALQATVVGERGVITLTVREGAAYELPAWQLETNVDTGRVEESLPPHEAPSVAIQHLAAAVAEINSDNRAAASTWDAATRAMEVVDAVSLSLEKGRTIDVIQQQLTERLAFRGSMAALGCGLLLVGFVVVLFVTLLGGAEVAAGQRLLPSWPTALLAVLSFFLLLQAVPFLAAKSKRRQPK